jgi:tRNA(fMet)-specific endonuclease VapC
MLYLLDTDTASYIIKGRHPQLQELRRRVASLSARDLCLSALTQAELLYGLKRLPPNHGMHETTLDFLSAIHILDWPAAGAGIYADIYHHLKTEGELIGEFDMLIAAQAISLNATLVTNNLRHYRRIHLPLRLENWAE